MPSPALPSLEAGTASARTFSLPGQSLVLVFTEGSEVQRAAGERATGQEGSPPYGSNASYCGVWAVQVRPSTLASAPHLKLYTHSSMFTSPRINVLPENPPHKPTTFL